MITKYITRLIVLLDSQINIKRRIILGKIAIVTDSNSGITQKEAKDLGVYVLPMPFMIDGNVFYEDVNLTIDEFFVKLENDCEISTSQPSPESVMNLWDDVLKEYYYNHYLSETDDRGSIRR